MKQDIENEIAVLRKWADSLENEGRIKDELIKEQDILIKTLKNHNAELKKMIDKLLGF